MEKLCIISINIRLGDEKNGKNDGSTWAITGRLYLE